MMVRMALQVKRQKVGIAMVGVPAMMGLAAFIFPALEFLAHEAVMLDIIGLCERKPRQKMMRD